MNEKMKNKAIAYEKNARTSVPTYDGLFDMSQAYFRAELGDKQVNLLVVGAGGGNEFSAWGPTNPNWNFTGVDPSEEMLQMASHKVNQLELKDRVKLIEGTVDDLPHSSEKFDAASCILVLHFIHDLEEKLKLLKGIKHQLKKGKPFVLVTAFGERESAELQHRINVWKSFFLDVGYTRVKVDQMGEVIMDISFISENDIEQLLQQAGFARITKFYSSGLFGGWMCHAE